MSETDQDIENNKLIKLSDDNKPPSGIKGWFWEPRPGIDKIPLRLFFKNRWFRAVVFFLYCFCCTEIHQGWQQLSRMLYRSGAYSWHCSPSELVGPYDYCTKQYNTISNLLTIGQSCEYVFGVVAGLSLDHVGPWPTGAIGIVMHLIGILLLVQSSESFKAYIPAMIFITGSINMVCFPMLCLADLFPNWRGLVISFVSCSQIVSTMMAPIWKPKMYLRYYLDDKGNRVYTLQPRSPDGQQPTFSAHPARFSPDDKFSHERWTCKKRYGLLPTQQPRPEI